ncbi:hypothetical protein K432DRAFT_254014, partial [Lepidopterella palustris CBS 459.81]
FGHALKSQEASLENLRMVIDEEEEECGWAWGMDPIGSLKGFEGLKRIQAAGIVLLPDADDPDDEGNGETEDPEDDA